MNLTAEIALAQRSLTFYLEHFADCEASHDALGQHAARRGIQRCLHVIRIAKNLSGPARVPASRPQS